MSPTNTAKEEITISLDVEAVKAPAIQNEKAHDDIDEPPLDNTLADDEYCLFKKKQLTMILSLLLTTFWLMTGLMLLTVKKILRKSLENDVSDKPEEHKVPGQETLLCCCNQWFLIGFPFFSLI